MTLYRNAISNLLCGLLVFTGTLCVCSTAGAETASASQADSHHSHHESATSPGDCGTKECPDCDPDALGQTPSYELKANQNLKLEPSDPEAYLASLATGPALPSLIALASPIALPPPHPADTPVRRWDLLLE